MSGRIYDCICSDDPAAAMVAFWTAGVVAATDPIGGVALGFWLAVAVKLVDGASEWKKTAASLGLRDLTCR